MEIKIIAEALAPYLEIQGFQDAATKMHGDFGATSIFIGTMRDYNDGENVKGMTLEHYPGMTEKQLANIVGEAMHKWQVIDVLVVHRVGDVFPLDPIVLVAVWSSHRGDAMDANRYIMEALKSRAPFWKKEMLLSEDAERWVDKNTDGYLKQ